MPPICSVIPLCCVFWCCFSTRDVVRFCNLCVRVLCRRSTAARLFKIPCRRRTTFSLPPKVPPASLFLLCPVTTHAAVTTAAHIHPLPTTAHPSTSRAELSRPPRTVFVALVCVSVRSALLLLQHVATLVVEE